jgi:hypothetical protein
MVVDKSIDARLLLGQLAGARAVGRADELNPASNDKSDAFDGFDDCKIKLINLARKHTHTTHTFNCNGASSGGNAVYSNTRSTRAIDRSNSVNVLVPVDKNANIRNDNNKFYTS